MSIINNDAAVLSAVTQKLQLTGKPAKLRREKPDDIPWTLPGFFGKSRVLTSFGQLPVEALRVRDPLKTPSGKYVRVTWIDQIRLDVQFLEQHPQAHPVFVKKNALGVSQPERSILISPAQKLKEPGRVGDDAMKPASALVGRTNVMRLPHSGFIYYLFHCDAPAVVSVEGVWFELPT